MWLIIARGLSGIGGGGIVNSVWVITTEIVPPGTQAKWSQALSVTWSASAVAGPILGGLFTGIYKLVGIQPQIPISDFPFQIKYLGDGHVSTFREPGIDHSFGAD